MSNNRDMKDFLNSIYCPIIASGDDETMRQVVTEMISAIAWGVASASKGDALRAARFLDGINKMLADETYQKMGIKLDRTIDQSRL